jgi:hypothetical protein
MLNAPLEQGLGRVVRRKTEIEHLHCGASDDDGD